MYSVVLFFFYLGLIFACAASQSPLNAAELLGSQRALEDYTYPTSIPSNRPSLAPSVFPTSASHDLTTETPTSWPSAVPSSSPTCEPSTRPTPTPSEGPVSSVSPTSSPSERPSRRPSSVTQLPSSLPTLLPSSTRTESPSSMPTSSPSTSQPSLAPQHRPTSSPTTVHPSSSPSFAPSSRPSLRPTIAPSSSPSTSPTVAPSAAPSQSPTGQPTSLPSAMPTPSMALIGKKWWYLIQTDVMLKTATSWSKYTHAEVQRGVQTAFDFVLADNVVEADVSNIFTVTEVYRPDDASKPSTNDDYYSSGVEGDVVAAVNDHRVEMEALSNATAPLFYHVETWCSSWTCQQSVHRTWSNIAIHPRVAVEPLHEQGIRAVDDVVVVSMATSITAVPPPIPPPLSPTRIVYIIIGVIIFVVTSYFIIKCGIHVWEQKRIIHRWFRSRWENLASPCQLFFYEVNRAWRGGFSLASARDEDSVDRSHDFDQLSVHYNKQNLSWQRNYIEDFDNEESQHLRPGSRDDDQSAPPSPVVRTNVKEISSNSNGAEVAMVNLPSTSTTPNGSNPLHRSTLPPVPSPSSMRNVSAQAYL